MTQQSRASLIEVEEAPSVRASLTDLMQGLAVSNNMTIASYISDTSKTSSKTTSKSSTSSTLPKVQVSPVFELSEHDEHVTDYCGNLIYEDGVLSKILFDGGCITLEDGSPVYHVYFRDHLGSVRVVCDRNGNAEQVNHYYPYGGLIGDLSTDDNKQKYRYKYNGKEFDRMYGLVPRNLKKSCN
ncbi:MAG: hypothetical protein Q3994_04925 [Prevotella sp.]|nr:hypothetical protein [Prevotella sp.]